MIHSFGQSRAQSQISARTRVMPIAISSCSSIESGLSEARRKLSESLAGTVRLIGTPC